uniref:Uncharacterized protein n=1 Tax=Romanomermis culicivorax TaxID=13658 RepID=A0A915KZB9_ROMCU
MALFVEDYGALMESSRLWNHPIINISCRLEDQTNQVNYDLWHYGTRPKWTIVVCSMQVLAVFNCQYE